MGDTNFELSATRIAVLSNALSDVPSQAIIRFRRSRSTDAPILLIHAERTKALDLRVGHGQDTHRLSRERNLLLGGVAIDFERGLVGHSDADVLLHAITDALLGACGLGDIGEWFPDSDPQWAGADSGVLLQSAMREVDRLNWKIINLDCTISAEKPKLSPYRKAIRERIAELLSIRPDQVNVKAKTGEGVGPVGRQEAIAADAIVLLTR
jgi:2-C-methyl-D-erythritol 2,4-cyclodiphosphate synthase